MKDKTLIKIKTIKVNTEDIFLKKVIKSGNGAVIPFFKQYIDKDVYVVIKEKIKKGIDK